MAVLGLELWAVSRDDAADLLVDGDRFDREAFSEVVVPDLLVSGDRPFVLVELEVQSTDLEQRANVRRIMRDELAVLDDRLVLFLFFDKRLRSLERFFAIDGHVENL